MTGPTGPGGAAVDRRDAALVVEAALSAVFDPALVRQMRPDSPLAGLPLTPADAVCLADAVADAAAKSGWQCRLDDADLDGVTTVADLVDAVAAVAEIGEGRT